ncbi:DUF4382 domain-containing protein [Solimonas fluminis]|nr:DUF4382 domain-containing protein [Solimonas fluminis]
MTELPPAATLVDMKNATLLRLSLLPLALGLAACESSLDIDLATVNRPVDAERISVRIRAVELQDEAGGTRRIETDDRLVNLLDFQGSELLSLVGGEEVPSARYRKLRLVFDERGAEIETDDGEFPIRVSDLQPGADIDIQLSDDDDETETLLAVLDLRFSFSRQTQPDNLYRLRQVATAGRSGDLGTLVGQVDEDYVQGGGCAGSEEEGFAMYLYRDDRRNQLTDYAADVTDSPLVSASVVRPGDEGDFSYRFRGLPAGRYTVAYTCKADLDDPFTRQDTLVFRDAFLVDIEEGGTTTRDF